MAYAKQKQADLQIVPKPLFQGRVSSQAGMMTWLLSIGDNQPPSFKSTCMYSKANEPPKPDLVSPGPQPPGSLCSKSQSQHPLYVVF